MSIFSEEVSLKAKAVFSDWIQVVDNRNPFTLNNFSSKDGVNELQVKPHCVTCTVVNKCWFKNEKGKKPDHFDYTSVNNSKIGSNIRGLYHPHCHCFEKGINTPHSKDIKVELNVKKATYFFANKGEWFYSWGYLDIDKNSFVKELKEKVLLSYIKGNYNKEKCTNAGFQINIFITIEGKNDKKGRFYDMQSAFMVYPNGVIKNVTPLTRRKG